MDLSSLGWDDFFAHHFQPFSADGLIAARVALEHKHAYALLSPQGEFAAVCTGRLLHHAASPADLPAVGDWVAIRPRTGETRSPAEQAPKADIHAVLPRRTHFSRRAAGDGPVEQIVAANVDTVFLVTGLDQNFSLRRIERYLAVARESGAQPVVVLNKADLHPDAAAAVRSTVAVAAGAPVVALSAALGAGLEGLQPWLVPGLTVALLGSSGVGKSTLINRLLGRERQATRAVSDLDDKGRHTTTRRELIVGPAGVIVMDTPGMRELQLWDVGGETLDATFADIRALAAGCRFSDCRHGPEPGCAVQAALEDGSLDAARWQSFQKLQREQAYAARKADARLDRENKAAWKKIHRHHRAHQRAKFGD